MKYEWRKQDKNLYLSKSKPEVIDVPAMNYFMIDGKGNPNDPSFSDYIEALYSLSYAVRMSYKSEIVPEGYYEYTVFPLEGIWDLAEEARDKEFLDKNKLIYTLMIRQPEFVTEKLARDIIERVKIKKSNKLLDKVKFNSIHEGLCVQMMHIGSYDDEPKSFRIMEEYCMANGLIRKEKTHREIYISDFRKTQPEKLKTVLRFKVTI
ncbi:GyrI-like domain-containing protein [Tissierella carlieri]|uniref:GyrI-like domain-containing protein n=1 Tax=Tissierella carlieri TaxID=689904 RepID=A0ABT1SDD1_9FIRM|nr:GyrI-like domain-containing protein [Tissierella carlieri]MCQ4924483.1 GyrI-like domain-containing protein [Tissierella carlieri]